MTSPAITQSAASVRSEAQVRAGRVNHPSYKEAQRIENACVRSMLDVIKDGCAETVAASPAPRYPRAVPDPGPCPNCLTDPQLPWLDIPTGKYIMACEYEWCDERLYITGDTVSEVVKGWEVGAV